MSHNSGGNRLMSIHSMLGGMSNNGNNGQMGEHAKRLQEESRPNSVPSSHGSQPLSPRQHTPVYRAASQPPVPGAHAHDPARFFAPPQIQESHYGLHSSQSYGHPQQQQQQQQHHRLPSNGHLGVHSQQNQYHMHNHSNMNHASYSGPAMHEREREREREREEEHRRERLKEEERDRERERERERERIRIHEREKERERQREKRERDRERERERERDRERERREGTRTPIGRYESARASPHNHLPHHHHHVHHSPAPFKKPKLTIISTQVFEEAKQYPESKLGRWTYNPTTRIPFKLRVNATFIAHIPRQFLDAQNNSALRRRKLWGTEIYTDDSDLAAILVHSTSRMPPTGDLEMVVRVMPRLLKYKSSMTNDLRSRGWLAKHDGLSLYCEQVSPVSWIKERQGKGFAKRSLEEMLYLSKTVVDSPTQKVDWPPRKQPKRSAEVLEEEQPVIPNEEDAMPEALANQSSDTVTQSRTEEGEGDETIELSMEDQTTDVETSFIEPPHGLISSNPDILPTALAQEYSAQSNPNDSVVQHEDKTLDDLSQDNPNTEPVNNDVKPTAELESAGLEARSTFETESMMIDSEPVGVTPSMDTDNAPGQQIKQEAVESTLSKDISSTAQEPPNSPMRETNEASQSELDMEARSLTTQPPDSTVQNQDLPPLPKHQDVLKPVQESEHIANVESIDGKEHVNPMNSATSLDPPQISGDSTNEDPK